MSNAPEVTILRETLRQLADASELLRVREGVDPERDDNGAADLAALNEYCRALERARRLTR